MFLGANTLECKSSRAIFLREAKIPGVKVPGSELAWERKGCESVLVIWLL